MSKNPAASSEGSNASAVRVREGDRGDVFVMQGAAVRPGVLKGRIAERSGSEPRGAIEGFGIDDSPFACDPGEGCGRVTA